MRVVSGAENYLNPLREALQNHFLPNLTALDLILDERKLMCKPVKHVGMGIDDPVFNAPTAFERSQQSTLLLTKAIKTGVNLTNYKSDIHVNKNQARISKDTQTCQEIQETPQRLPCKQHISIQRKLNSKCSSWLPKVPTNDNVFSISSTSLGMRYLCGMGNNRRICPLTVMVTVKFSQFVMH